MSDIDPEELREAVEAAVEAAEWTGVPTGLQPDALNLDPDRSTWTPGEMIQFTLVLTEIFPNIDWEDPGDYSKLIAKHPNLPVGLNVHWSLDGVLAYYVDALDETWWSRLTMWVNFKIGRFRRIIHN